MTVCPLDFRYGRPGMKAVFDEENRLQRILDVEAALAQAQAKAGNIKQDHADIIKKTASTRYVKLDRVREIDQKINHEITAIIRVLSEQCGESGKFVHVGATSNDILDTGAALQIRDAIKIVDDDLGKLRKTLAMRAKEHRDTIMVGRTHGQWALPITFGLKLANYSLEVHRHQQRLTECSARILVGKMSGAVGTGAGFGPKALEIQANVMEHLGLGVEEGPTQIVARDRYVELISVLANISCSIEKFATEVRNLQRGEIAEVSEFFDDSVQVGSSTMANKRNPVTAENICGLARIVRGFMTPAYESAMLWHERDLTNSSAERFFVPHSFILVDDMLAKLDKLFETLVVDPAQMERNLAKAGSVIMAESVLLALVGKGMGRQEAHELIRKCSMESQHACEDFKSYLMANKDVRALLSEKEIDAALDPRAYLGSTGETVDHILKLVA
ncbi:MAG: adenylosuccinate lyase [Thermoplasmatota archaeon]|nr:adenylosuccinate lyase [Candidatus Thermoplasmatota archaeon]MBU1915006.1 adenylosuccinate lyase [Candidatus Thermoplasmatota archaeon]